MNQRYYEEDEAQAILKRAAEISHQRVGALDYDRLKATAEELGISEDALMQAEEEVRHQRAVEAERREFLQERKSGYIGHLAAYIIVNSFLVAMSVRGGNAWFWGPLLGWGIGLAFHTLGTYFPSKKELDKEFAEWRTKRQLAADPQPVLDNAYALVEQRLASAELAKERIGQLEMIKYVRDRTGLDLHTAKKVVDSHFARRPGAWR